MVTDAGPCDRERAAQVALLDRAETAGCTRTQDCAIVGSCDQGFGFVAVPLSFVAETQALMDATQCNSFDGPFFGAACESGQCVARENGGACGSEEPPFCATGQLVYENPCVNASPSDATILTGCHTPCHPDAAMCPEGFTCSATSVCPINSARQAEGCWQCDAITTFLCVP
jgi:hypothetical protein